MSETEQLRAELANARADRRAYGLKVAEAVAKRCEDLARNPSGPEGEDGYNLEDIATSIDQLDLDEILAEIP